MYIELCEYDEVSIFTHMTHKLYEYHHFLVFFLIHVFLIVLLQDTCGHIEEVKSVTSRKLQVPCAVPPPVPANHGSRCVSEEVPGLFRMLSDHVQTTTFSWVLLRVNTLISAISSLSSTSEAIPELSRHVSGKSGHQEPGDPGSQARRHPRFCSHAPGLLHDSGRDRVQHYSRR